MYQCAMTMFMLITGCLPEYPPTLVEARLFDVVRPSRGFTTELTWGAALLLPEFGETDKVLRHFIARCMIDDPTRRPSMQDFEIVLKRYGFHVPDEPDEGFQWVVQEGVFEV